MKTKKGICTIALTASLFSAVTAQRKVEPEIHKWAPSDIINLHDSVAVYKTVSKIVLPNPEMTVAVIDKNGALAGPEVPLPKNTLGMAMLGGNLLAIYPDTKRGENRELHALLIDLAQRKTLEDKVIYSEPSDYNTEFIMERDPDGNFQAILARITTLKSKRQIADLETYKDEKRYAASSDLQMITLSSDLESKRTQLNSALINGFYLASAINSSGELFLVSIGVGEMVTEKFSKSGALENKLSETFLPREKLNVDFIGHLVASTGNAMIVATKYERADKKTVETAFSFDFEKGKVLVAKEDILDKYYVRSLKNDQTQAAEVKTAHNWNIDNLKPVSIVDTKDYIAVCKEIQYTVTSPHSNGADYVSDAAIIAIYDHQMNLLRSVNIDKNMDSYEYNYPGINIHIDGDKLFAVTAESAHVTTVSEFAYSIDLRTGSLERKRLKKINYGGNRMTRPLYTFWLKDGFVMNYIHQRWGTPNKVESYFEASEYE